MAKLIRKWVKTAKRRIRVGLQDLRTWRLYMAGRELLSEREIDDIKVVELCKMAGISVGAFYGRFETKAAFLSFLIRERLGEARQSAESALSAETLASLPLDHRLAVVVEHQLKAFHGPMGGVVRACVRSGGRDLAQVEAYRAEVAGLVVASLCTELGTVMERDVRAAVQLLHAALIDVLMFESGALKRGRRRTLETLTQTLQGYLGLDIVEIDADPLRGDEAIQMDEELILRPVDPDALAAIMSAKDKAKPAPSAPAAKAKPRAKARADTRRLRAKLV